MFLQKSFLKKIFYFITIAAINATVAFFPVQRAAAADAWGVAAQALGVFAAYKSTLVAMLAIGNNAAAQMECRRQDIKANGRDQNENDTALVDAVMLRLVNNGDYALKANSLPFVWSVNDSNLFNAGCYPTNYISVNKGLVRGLQCDEDAIAAVLAHEMTHGLEQHSAKNYAKAVAQYYGMAFLNMSLNSMDWNRLNALANYSIAQNIMVPTEYAADEGGFFIMTSAGFNPGGPAAAMARMSRYLRYETTEFLEYESQDKPRQNEYSDHPETEAREKKLAAMLTAYGAGHVVVRNRKEVFIDGEFFAAAEATDEAYDNTAENAYYLAGGIAKAFHDYDDISGWNFRDEANGKNFLNDDRCYSVLKYFVARKDLTAKLAQIVAKSYAAENRTGARAKLRADEAKRRAELDAEHAKTINADAKLVRDMRRNGDIYSDYGRSDLALAVVERAMNAKNNDDYAEALSIRARARALDGDFAAALADADRAVGMNDKNVYNYLNRADVYRMRGDWQKAVDDANAAIGLDETNAAAWLVAAELFDDANDREKAMTAYKKFHELAPDATIPMNYLKEIDPKKAAEIEKKDKDNEANAD